MANTPRFVAPLDPQTVHRLKDTMRTSPVFRVRQRAHAILLSTKAYRIDQLVDIFEVDRDTITRWLDRWDEDQFEGLEDAPRSGRPAFGTPALDSDRGRTLGLETGRRRP